MRCIFCKKKSDFSKSVEHIIPETLGNKKTILPVGCVCDGCNNYFATKIEKFVLESEEFNYLRFNQMIENKKGKIPEAKILVNGVPATARRLNSKSTELGFSPEDYNKILKQLKYSEKLQIIIPMTGDPPKDIHVSRWLAKMALEGLISRVLNESDWNEYFVNHEGLDVIRNYARSAKKGEFWPYSKRRLYDANELKIIKNDECQIIYEWDILVIGSPEQGEYYFILCVFGMEYAINISGPSMDGYYQWLKSHNNQSPLYVDKSDW